jgi:hypothetical protein
MNITEIILNWGIPTLIGALITFVFTLVAQNKALRDSMVAVLRGLIVSNCEQYNKLKYLPDYARYTINELGKNYSKLGGNHGIKELILKTNQLPPIKMKRSK